MLPERPKTKPRNHEEHDEQKKLIHIIRNELAPQHPILNWLYSVPNGLLLHPSVRTQMINEGSKAGVPDLFLPVRSGQYSGLYIEMKSATGKLSAKQKEFKIFVEDQGYKFIVPRSCEEALSEILAYCGIPYAIRS
jgi:hypothetical protein